jgi:DNA-binding CsgD family transcriptional regulator
MEHLKVAYYFLVLLVGAAAIAYAVLMSRAYRLPFLGPLAWFLGFNNALALINLTSAYACANLIGFCTLGQYTVLAGILGPMARLSLAGIVYAVFAIARGFDGRRPSRRFSRWFGAAAGLLAATCAVASLAPRGSSPWIWTMRGQFAASVLSIVAILGALLALVLNSRKIASAEERKAVRAFGVSYFAIYAVFVITFWFPAGVQFFPNALVLLAINVFPLVWFRKPFAEAYATAASSADDRESLERFCRTRGLTAREGAILELILRGKSNAQIEKELFISIHTVKNHITNIHQKLGVRSRWQLISLFHAGRRERPTAEPPAGPAEIGPRTGLRPQ